MVSEAQKYNMTIQRMTEEDRLRLLNMLRPVAPSLTLEEMPMYMAHYLSYFGYGWTRQSALRALQKRIHLLTQLQ